MSPDEAAAFMADLDVLDQRSAFFLSGVTFSVAEHKAYVAHRRPCRLHGTPSCPGRLRAHFRNLDGPRALQTDQRIRYRVSAGRASQWHARVRPDCAGERMLYYGR